jgi:hypothetical protein
MHMHMHTTQHITICIESVQRMSSYKFARVCKQARLEVI